MATKDTILVIGATGAQGGGVARSLLAAGKFAVRGLTRSPDSEKAQALRKAGAEMVQGDLSDVASIRRAVDGCYGVFGVTSFWEHFGKELAHGKNLLDALTGANVGHLVMSTLPSVKKAAGHLNVPHFDLKAEMEEHARSLGLPATFIHVAFYFENFIAFVPPQKTPDGSYALGFPQGDTPLAGVAVEDVGPIVARVFENREAYLGKTIRVVGDELPVAKYGEIMARELGKPITYNHIPREVYAKFGFPGAEEVADMFEYYRSHVPSRRADIEQCRSIHPNLQSFEQWMKQNKDRMNAVIAA